MKIVTNHYAIQGERKEIADDCIYFEAEDGNAMFEVRQGSDGASIEIRAVGFCKVGGLMYRAALGIEPQCANGIIVRALRYE